MSPTLFRRNGRYEQYVQAYPIARISHTSDTPAPAPMSTGKEVPKVLMFHNPYSARSCKLLKELHSAKKSWPNSRFKTGPPLEFDLTVETRLPTTEELQDLYDLLDASTWTTFFDYHNGQQQTYRTHPTGARTVIEAVMTMQAQNRKRIRDAPPHPTELRHDPDHPLFGTDQFAWPIVVCWNWRLISLGIHGMKGLNRMFKEFTSMRPGGVKLTPAQIQEEKTQAQRAKYDMSSQLPVSPPEDDTLEWFKETSFRPPRDAPHSFGSRRF